MSRQWDEMTPEQQRAIGEAAVDHVRYSDEHNCRGWHDTIINIHNAVHAAECPTWSVRENVISCSDGVRRIIFAPYVSTREERNSGALTITHILNAHEREKRGIK